MKGVKTKHTISKKEKEQYAKLLILFEMINNKTYYKIMMEGDFQYIEPLFNEMNVDEYIRVEGNRYVPTEKGRTVLNKFMQRFFEYLKIYDIFAFVDLEEGVFAFEEGYELDGDEYDDFIEQERWDDVRVAVAEFKKMNVCEIIFMSFVNEGRFDMEKAGWQFDITSGLVWDDIIHIANNSITTEEINAEADDALECVVREGQRVAVDLIKRINEEKEEEDDYEDEGEGEDEGEKVIYVETVVEEEHHYDYWDLYYDPFYISPCYCDPYW